MTHDQTKAMTLGGRIIIIRDGFIQQIGTPQEVFHYPADLFGAGFIGTPQMDLSQDAKLLLEGGQYAVEIFGKKFPLLERKQAALKAANCPAGPVIAGVRPQYIHLEYGGISSQLEMVEMMGSEQHLYLNIGGREVVALVPTTGTGNRPEMGEIDFLPENIHLLNPQTEKNLLA